MINLLLYFNVDPFKITQYLTHLKGLTISEDESLYDIIALVYGKEGSEYIRDNI